MSEPWAASRVAVSVRHVRIDVDKYDLKAERTASFPRSFLRFGLGIRARW
jgi:hypothetical protein